MKDLRTRLSSPTGFVPRTQSQALQGYIEGVISLEYFVYRAVNVRPLLEQPFDLGEVDRLLAKGELDPDNLELLMALFQHMLKDPDKELALYAAESVSALERRYMERLRELKSRPSWEREAEPVARVLEAYADLARMNAGRRELRDFYLYEIIALFRELRGICAGDAGAVLSYLRALLALGRMDEAADELRAARAELGKLPELVALSAELAYLAGNASAVAAELASLRDRGPVEATPETAELVVFWTGGRCYD